MYKVKIAVQVKREFSDLKQALRYADEYNEKLARMLSDEDVKYRAVRQYKKGDK